MSEISQTPLCGLILAGGRSERMGRDKASLVHPDGRTLGRRGYDLLTEAGCSEVFLSLREDQETPAGFEDFPPNILRDEPGGSSGPISGILSAMKLRPNADWLVVACDLPRLDLQTIETLVLLKLDGEKFLAYRSEFDGLPEPLCTWYSKDAREIFENAGSACPRKILIRNECRLLDPVTYGALDNANTPRDWELSTQA